MFGRQEYLEWNFIDYLASLVRHSLIQFQKNKRKKFPILKWLYLLLFLAFVGLFLLSGHPPDLYRRKHSANMYWFDSPCFPCSQPWSVDSTAPLRKRRSRQAGVFLVTAAPEINKGELSAEEILEACICRCKQLGFKERASLGRQRAQTGHSEDTGVGSDPRVTGRRVGWQKGGSRERGCKGTQHIHAITGPLEDSPWILSDTSPNWSPLGPCRGIRQSWGLSQRLPCRGTQHPKDRLSNSSLAHAPAEITLQEELWGPTGVRYRKGISRWSLY